MTDEEEKEWMKIIEEVDMLKEFKQLIEDMDNYHTFHSIPKYYERHIHETTN